MNSSQAIVVGAAIALVGSLAGGFVSPLVLSIIDGARAKKALLRDIEKERQESLGLAIREFLEALLELSVVDKSIPEGARTGLKRAMMASLDLGLLLSQPDQPIAVVVASSTSKVAEDAAIASAIIETLTSVLPAWRRGLLTAREALVAYREKSGDPAPVDDLPEE